MSGEFVVFSFYTVNTPYEHEVPGFVGSCQQFEIPVTVIKCESQGSWVQNVNLKPSICLHVYEKYECPIVYIDIDARIKAYPELFKSIDCDIALHYRMDRELLSGTIYFNHTEATKNLLLEWKEECERFPKDWDQRSLQRVLQKNDNINVYKLPPQYTKIFDIMKKVENPVIEHYQKSRTYRNKIIT